MFTLSVESIASELKTKFIGKNIFYFDEIDSTNSEAKKKAAQGAAEGTVLVAQRQSGGRGRLERSFFCPPGGLWFSIILRPAFAPADAPKCTLMAAVAVVEAMKYFGVEAKIKWPNDIQLSGKKITGILTEMSASLNYINYVIIGTGINVNIDNFPPELTDTATSLSNELGVPIDLNFLLSNVLNETEKLYISVLNGGFADILQKWRQNSLILGREVEVMGVKSGENFIGKAIDIDEDGALLVKVGNEVRQVLAGDVSVRFKTGTE